ncbi:MAG: amidase family protein [Acidobacteriota bacterium]
MESAIAVIRKISGRITETTLPPTFPLLIPITGPEAYAFHAKTLAESEDLYQPFTRDRIIQFAADIKPPPYANALRQTNLLRREIRKVFLTMVLLITSTMPNPAESSADAKTFDPVGLQNSSPFNIFGLPTISVPCGITKSGLPIGLQISGAPWAESTVLSLARAYERATEWHKKRPKLGSM